MTPALDALLKEVDARRLMSRLPDLRQLAGSEARLAAMLRVAVDALAFYESGNRNAFRCNNERLDPSKGTGPCCERVIDAGGIAQDALARIERIAAGDQGEP